MFYKYNFVLFILILKRFISGKMILWNHKYSLFHYFTTPVNIRLISNRITILNITSLVLKQIDHLNLYTCKFSHCFTKYVTNNDNVRFHNQMNKISWIYNISKVVFVKVNILDKTLGSKNLIPIIIDLLRAVLEPYPDHFPINLQPTVIIKYVTEVGIDFDPMKKVIT